MRLPSLLSVAVVIAALFLAAGLARTLVAGDRGRSAAIPASRGVAPPRTVSLREEALRLYAAGEFPPACDRLMRAADGARSGDTAREEVGRCFEGWGWQALREGRADESMALFRNGLEQAPDVPALLRGFGIAAVHAGRLRDALGPLERSARAEFDAPTSLLLARLYDQRDEPEAAVRHLRALLARDPGDEPARRLLQKLERERRAEAGFQRDTMPGFLIKDSRSRPAAERAALRESLAAASRRIGRDLDSRRATRLTVIVYDAAVFGMVTRARGDVSGIFDGKIRLPVGETMPAADVLERLVAHEYTHALVHELSRGRAPRWLHEGLAQAMEGGEAESPFRLDAPITLVALEALVSDREPSRARDGYVIALGVVHDLIDRGGMAGLRSLLHRLAGGDDVAAAVLAVYGLRLAELESQWSSRLGG